MMEPNQDHTIYERNMVLDEKDLSQTDLLDEFLFLGNEEDSEATRHIDLLTHVKPQSRVDAESPDVFDQFINKEMVVDGMDQGATPGILQLGASNMGLPTQLHNATYSAGNVNGDGRMDAYSHLREGVNESQQVLTGSNMEQWQQNLQSGSKSETTGWEVQGGDGERNYSRKASSGSSGTSMTNGKMSSYYQQCERLLSHGLQFGRTSPFKTVYLNPVYFLPKENDSIALPYKLHVDGIPSVSRVETQIKVGISISPPPKQFLIHLPTDCITKQKFYLSSDISEYLPDVQNEMLYLETFLICSSTNKPTYVCARCVKREQRRGARRKSGVSDNMLWCNNENKRAVVFNSKQVVLIKEEDCDDLSKRFSLSARIVCYCRHHKEPEGFRILLVLRDSEGTVLGRTVTNPIVIMDKKTPTKGKSSSMDSRSSDYSSYVKDEDSLTGVTSDYSNTESYSNVKREDSTSGVLLSVPKNMPSPTSITEDSSENVQTDYGKLGSTANFLHSSAAASARTSGYKRPRPSLDGTIREANSERSLSNSSVPVMGSTSTFPTIAGTSLMQNKPTQSPPQNGLAVVQQQRPLVHVQQMGSSFTNTKPFIQRVIPAQGPIKGGIEVTLLGSNFKPNMVVKFGESKALSTQCWSESTIVTYLPPASKAGQVLVSVFQCEENDSELLGNMSNSRALFTYVDDTDRQLIELALQIVGLKMNGKLEDARNIAKRIVGNDGGSSTGSTPGSNISPSNNYGTSHTSQVYYSDEMLIIKVVKLLNPGSNLSMCNEDGQTMLHLACLKGYFQLTSALVKKGARVNVSDSFGFTPLHFACLNGDFKIIQLLIECKADISFAADNGVTARELYISQHVSNSANHNAYTDKLLQMLEKDDYDQFSALGRKMSDSSLHSSLFDVDSLDSVDDGFQVHVSKLVEDTLSDDSEYEYSNYEEISESDSLYSHDDPTQATEIEHSDNNPLFSETSVNDDERLQTVSRSNVSPDHLPKYEDLFPTSEQKADKTIAAELSAVLDHQGQSSPDLQDSQSSEISEDEEEALQVRLNRFFQQRQNFKNDKMLIFFWIPVMIILSSAFLAFQFGKDGNRIHHISEHLSEKIRTWMGKTILGNDRMKAAFRESIHNLQNHRLLGENNYSM